MATSTEPNGLSDLLIAKIVASISLGLCSFLIGVSPIKLQKLFDIRSDNEDKNLIISLLLCFGGGVLLFTTFIHLQPEVREIIAGMEERDMLPMIGHGLPTSELIFCFGFFFVYVIEELVHMFLDRKLKDDTLHRTLSVRCPKQKDHLTIPRVSLNKVEDSSIDASSKDLYNSQSTVNFVVTRKHDHHHHHHHDHGHFDRSGGLKNSFRGLLAVLALSFHAVFEGLAVGLENSVDKVWYLFAAIATHKLVIAFCVGVELISSKTKLLFVLIYIGTFAAVTPLGIGIGILLSETGRSEEDVTSVILQGMAAGTLLYVVFFEVLARERNNRHSGLWQFCAIFVGFAVMFALQLLTGHEHSHGHHEHDGGIIETTAATTAAHLHSHRAV